MTELATHFVRLLGQTTVALAVAVIAVGLILRGLRVTSPTAHRVGWTLALLVGWWFVRLSAQVPWYEPAAEPAPKYIANQTSTVEPSQFTGTWTDIPTGQIAAATPEVAQALPDEENGLIEIGPGGDATTYLEPSAVPALTDDLAIDVTSPAIEPEMPIIVAGGKLRDSETPIAAPASTATAATAAFCFWPLVVVAVWAIGVGFAVMAWAFGYVRFVRRLPPALPAPESWADQWQALQTAHNIQRQIPLRVTEQLGPMLCRLPRGYALLVPEALWRDLDSSQRAAVLRHELAHYQRRDVWKSLAVRVLALPHWFNPLAWLAVRRFDDAAEWACDHAAAADEPATQYARTLVRLGESAARHAAYSPAVRGASLRGRVRRLLNSASDRDSIFKKLLLSAMALVAVIGLAVRVELVAKERAEATIDGATDEPTAAAAKAEVAAESSANYVLSETVEVEPLSEADAELVEAAERGFKAASAAYANDTNTLDEVCAWSLRWLSAIQATAKSPDAKVAAAKANLERFQALRTQIKALFDVGARGGEAENMAMVDYYVADAKRRITKAQREAETAKQMLLKARDKAVDMDHQLRESKARLEDVRETEARVEAAKKKLDELTKASDVTNFTDNPTAYEAARLKAVDAEHDLEEAVRDAIAAREAYLSTAKQGAAATIELGDLATPGAATAPSQSRDRKTIPSAVAPEDQETVNLQRKLNEANAGLNHARRLMGAHADDLTKAMHDHQVARDRAAIVLKLQDEIRKDDKVSALEQDIAKRDAALADLKAKAGDGNEGDQVKQLESERAGLQEQLAARIKQLEDEKVPLEGQRLLTASEKTLANAMDQLDQLNEDVRQYIKQVDEATAQLQAIGAPLASGDEHIPNVDATPSESPKGTRRAASSNVTSAIDEELATLLTYEENLRQAQRRYRFLRHYQTEARRTRNSETIKRAGEDLEDARSQVQKAEAVIKASQASASTDERHAESRARDRVEETEITQETAQQECDAARDVQRDAAAKGDQQKFTEAAKLITAAGQKVSAAGREADRARAAVESRLQARVQRQKQSEAPLDPALQDSAATRSIVKGLKNEIQSMNEYLQQSARDRQMASINLKHAQQEKKELEVSLGPALEKIEQDSRVSKLTEDIAKYDEEIAEFKQAMKPGAKTDHTFEKRLMERIELRNTLNERIMELAARSLKPEDQKALQVVTDKVLGFTQQIEFNDRRTEAMTERIRKAKLRLKQLGDDTAIELSAERKQQLRYNGRSFAQWQAQLETELSAERLIECCEAFTAFARNGFGSEAAAQVVEVGCKFYKPPDQLNNTVSELTRTTTKMLRELPIEFILPTLTAALQQPQSNQRQYAAYILSRRSPESATVIPALLKAAEDPDPLVVTFATTGLAKTDFNDHEVVQALLAAISDHDNKLAIASMRAVEAVYKRRDSMLAIAQIRFPPLLLERLKDQDFTLSAVAGQALSVFGPDCAPALPTVIPWLKEGGERQKAAFAIIDALGPVAEPAIGTLIELAERGGTGDVKVIQRLGAFGPAAKDAIPLLEKIATRDAWPQQKVAAIEALPFIRGERPLTELKPKTGLQREIKAESAAHPTPEAETNKAPANTQYK